MNATIDIAASLQEAHPEIEQCLRLAHQKASGDESPLTVTHLAHELLTAPSVRRRIRTDNAATLPGLPPPVCGAKGKVAFDLAGLLGRAAVRAQKWKQKRIDAACLLAEALSEPELASAGLRADALSPRRKSPFGFGCDLTEEAASDEKCPVCGMLEAYETLLSALSSKRAPVLIAEPGVGKTHLVKGLAWHLVHGPDNLVPTSLRGLRIVAVSRLDLLAGTQDRGRLEKRLKRLFDALAADETIVPFFDEAHAMFGSGDDAGVTIANAIKERLSVNGLRMIWATTPAEFYRHISVDQALVSRVVPIPLSEPDEALVLEILKAAPANHLPEAVGPGGVLVGDDARSASYRFTEEFRRGLPQPRNSVALLIDAIGDKHYALQTGRTQSRELTTEDVARALSARSGLPLPYLLADPAERARQLRAQLTAKVRGQGAAVSAVVEYLRAHDAGLGGATRPRGIFLFVGPSGVGKSLLAESLAPNKASLFRLCLGASGQSGGSEVRGAAPGYIGFGATQTVYSHVAIRQASVVIVEGLARAEGAVVEALLEAMEGRGKDAAGREADFRQVVFCLIATNLASVPPEILERVDRVVRFDPLDEQAMLLALDDRISAWKKSSRRPCPRELDDPHVRIEIVSGCLTQDGGNVRQLESALTDWFLSR